jgi:chemosensory pili system protein ChpC
MATKTRAKKKVSGKKKATTRKSTSAAKGPDKKDQAKKGPGTSKNARPKKAAGKKTPRSKATKRSGTPEEHVDSNATDNSSATNGTAFEDGSEQSVIHCTLARMESESMLLPTSVVAEIAEFSPPQPIESAPAWLLGQIEWENWQVPVISYSALINGVIPEEVTNKSRTMIIKSLSDASRVPYVGVLVADLPKLSQVKPGNIEETSDDTTALGVFSRVLFKGKDTIIPDLDRLSQLVAHAAYGTLPDGQTGGQAS